MFKVEQAEEEEEEERYKARTLGNGTRANK